MLLAGVRGYFWDFDRVTPFPVPALLKNLPEDGTEMIAPEDPAGGNAEVRAALATGNLSLEAVPAPTTNPSESSDSPREALVLGDGMHIKRGASPAGIAPHTEAVGVVSAPTAATAVVPYPSQAAKERHTLAHQDSFTANDSFMSARSSLDHAWSFGSAASASASASASVSTSGGELRDGRGAPTGDSGVPPGSPIDPVLPNVTPPSGAARGVFTDMSGDSGAISLPWPP